MLNKLESLSAFIGNTPLVRLENENSRLFAKLEYNNFSGSIKDRAAYSIIYNGIKSRLINQETTVIASSSGNLAVSLASICKILKLKFIPVLDSNVNETNEILLNLISYKVIKVNERDEAGGYLLNRIKKVSDLIKQTENSFCADQYSDPNNYKGYYKMADEILQEFKSGPDMIFMAVSSSGSITGISKHIKSIHPNVKIIAVDVEGSIIFGSTPRSRFISGIGSSLVPDIIKNACIDEVIHLSQSEIVKGCLALLDEQAIFGGASSGAVYMAAKEYLSNDKLNLNGSSILLIFPDRGYSYINTIYNTDWVNRILV